MSITIIGDPHTRLEPVESIMEKEQSDYILCTGDLGSYQNFPIPFYFIHGNHEDFDELENIDSGKRSYHNLYHIKCGEIVDIGGLKISGLSGNYSPKRFEWKRSRLKQARRRHFVKSDVDKCLNIKDVDIFLSHEAPSHIGVTIREKEAGISHVREIIEKVQPQYAFFGHFHHHYKGKIGNTQVHGMPRPEDGYGILEKDSNESWTLNFIDNNSEEK